MRRIHVPYFRIIYRISYTVLLIILIILLAVTPGDHIFQTLSNGKLAAVFIISAVYLITGLLAIFIFASRLYTSRTTLAAIPKPYLPIEEGEVPRNVRRMIVEGRQRSALIAWESRPRDLRNEDKVTGEASELRLSRFLTAPKKLANVPDTVLRISADAPPWGDIMHPGWCSPASDDHPDLQFETVVAELPNLIEAKAVSLAPPDQTVNLMSADQDEGPPPPDPRAVAILQRPQTMGLRDYLTNLDSLSLINPPTLLFTFLARYEYARFSMSALTELEFHDLMAVFADILSGMVWVDPKVLAEYLPSDTSSAFSQQSGHYVKSVTGRSTANGTSSPSENSLASTHSVVRHHGGNS